MPQVRMRDITNTIRTLTRIRARDSTNTLRTIQRVRGRDATNTLRTLWTSMGLTLNDNFLTEIDSGASTSGTTTGGPITGTVSGGTAGYTYAWTRISGDSNISATSPTAAASSFTATCFDGVMFEATFRLTVTDSTGATATADLLVQMTWADTR